MLEASDTPRGLLQGFDYNYIVPGQICLVNTYQQPA